jgi:hypothetical protein
MNDSITVDAAARLGRLGERYFTTQHTYDPYNATLLGLSEFDHLAGDPSAEASEQAATDFAAIGREVAAMCCRCSCTALRRTRSTPSGPATRRPRVM